MKIGNVNQLENNEIWPIVPPFLVKSVITKDEKYYINKHGVYASDTVRGLLADASDDPDIQNPLSLFQVVPESYEFDKFSYIGEIKPSKEDFYLNSILDGQKIIRIDPNFLYKIKTCCDKFRICNGYENRCHEQDCRIALLYHKRLKDIHCTNDFDNYFKILNLIIDEYNIEIAKDYPLHCERDKTYNRLYVWYQCPYSKLIEYFFPIIHSGKVIAVLMQGQRIPNDIKKEDIFHEVLNDTQIEPQYKEDLQRSIIAISDTEFCTSPMPDNRLKAIWKRIRTLEERIDEEVMTHARAYIYDNFNKIENEFHKHIKYEIKKTGKLINESYKIIVNEALQKICNIFNKDGYIHIYSTEEKFEEEASNVDTFYLIGTSLNLTEKEYIDCRKIKFYNLPSDLDKLEKMLNEDFNSYLKQAIKFNDNVIFRIESLSIGDTKHLIWSEYPKRKEIDIVQYNEFSNFLSVFFHTLWESYNLLRSVNLRKQLETSMRVSVHETAQIIPVIINTLKKEYKIDSKILIDEDLLDIHGIHRRITTIYDTIHRLNLLDNLYKRSTLMFKELTPKTEWADLRQLIYSVRNMCNDKARYNNNQNIIVEGINGFKFNQYNIYTDDQLISHVLFNLVDNAIKYGYMGSNIRINVALLDTNMQYEKNSNYKSISSLIISVISYGDVVDEDTQRNLYKLFYRSPTSKVKDGMGIGLFLVKKICTSMGYTISFKSEKLSTYNVPLYYYYVKKMGKNSTLKTISQALIKEIVNEELINDWSIEDLEFDAAINSPTYRNEFIITLNKINSNLIKQI